MGWGGRKGTRVEGWKRNKRKEEKEYGNGNHSMRMLDDYTLQ